LILHLCARPHVFSTLGWHVLTTAPVLIPALGHIERGPMADMSA